MSGTFGLHSCPLLPPAPLGIWLWILCTFHILFGPFTCIKKVLKTSETSKVRSGSAFSVPSFPLSPLLAPRLPCRPSQSVLGLLQWCCVHCLAPFWSVHGVSASPLPSLPWHSSGAGSHSALSTMCLTCLAFILSNASYKISGGRAKFALNKALPSWRKQCTAREPSLWHRHGLCLQHFKKGLRDQRSSCNTCSNTPPNGYWPILGDFYFVQVFFPQWDYSIKPNKTLTLCVHVALHVHAQFYSFSQHTFRDSGVKSPAATALTYKWSFDSLVLTVNWITLRD